MYVHPVGESSSTLPTTRFLRAFLSTGSELLPKHLPVYVAQQEKAGIRISEYLRYYLNLVWKATWHFLHVLHSTKPPVKSFPCHQSHFVSVLYPHFSYTGVSFRKTQTIRKTLDLFNSASLRPLLYRLILQATQML